MKNIIFLFIFVFFIGCAQKEITLNVNLKGEQNNLKCSEINITSNNKIIENIFKNNLYKIILYPNEKKCNIFIKNKTKKMIKNYTKKIKIIYTKKYPRCNYFKQTCIIKGNYYFCSKFKKISPNEYNIIKNYKYKYQNYFLENPNSNIAYKIYKECKPKYLNIKCKKGYFLISNYYFVNKKQIFNQYKEIFFNTCEDINNYCYYNEIPNLKNNIEKSNSNIDNLLKEEYKILINKFIKNFFPHQEILNITLFDPEIKNKKIEQIYKNISNNNISLNDLYYLNNFLKNKKFKDKKTFYKLEIMKYTLILKLNLIKTSSQKEKFIKELNKILKNCNLDICSTLNEIKNIIQNLELNIY